MEDKIKVAALGGLDESGRDCYIIEINDDIFVVEAGCRVPDNSIPGVDYMLPNFDYLIANKNRVKAYFMTHGHDENMGALQFVYDSCPAPIYCTHATKIIMTSARTRTGSSIYFDFVEVNPNQHLVLFGHEIQLFQTVHNAAYSFGVCFKTSKGNIVYTGDYILDFMSDEEAYRLNLKVIQDISKEKTFLLLAESKGANKTGYCAPKHLVEPQIYKYFKYGHKRIFITCFWQNFFRINEICKLVREYHKKIYFYNDYTRDVMEHLMKADKSICLEENDIISTSDLLRMRNEEVVILLLGRGEKLYLELQKLVYKTNEDKRIVITGDDIFINVALPTPTLETLATRSMDALYRTECEVIWVKPKNIASMHAYQDDLKFFISLLKPQYYLPVRGSYVNLIANAKLALSMNEGYTHNNIFIIDNGMQIVFDDKPRPTILTQEQAGIPTIPYLVDGLGISKVADAVIDDRRKLGQDGVVLIAATVSRSGKRIIAGPDCQMRGFVFVKEAEPLLKSLSQIFIEETNIALLSNSNSFDKAINNIKDRCQKFIRRENGRQPLIIPIIIPIN